MVFPLVTTIYVAADIEDINGTSLPQGGYHFSIISFYANEVHGEIYCGSVYRRYKFTSETTIRLMAAAQSRIIRRSSASQPARRTSSPVLPENVILPRHSYSRRRRNRVAPSNSSIRRIMCTICLEYIERNAKTLSCCHRFHHRCINRWLLSHNSCPLCRHRIPRIERLAWSVREPSQSNSRSSSLYQAELRRRLSRPPRESRRREYEMHFSSVPGLIG